MLNKLYFLVLLVFSESIYCQKYSIYDHKDSLGNVTHSELYINEDEIKKLFNVPSFNITKFNLESMSLLPLQSIFDKQIDLKRIPFYDPYISEILQSYEMYFIGKLTIKNLNLSHYIFASLAKTYHSQYYLFNYYNGRLVSVHELCSKTANLDFPEFSYVSNSEIRDFIFDKTELIFETKYKGTNEYKIDDTKEIFTIEKNGRISVKQKY